MSKRNGTKKTVKPTNEKWRRLQRFLQSEDFAKTCGVFFLLFSLFLLFSMVSFFLKGGNTPNWCGGVGFWFARVLIESTFGIGALGFCFLSFLYGLRLLKREPLPFWKTIVSTFFWMTWLSCTVAYVDHLAKNVEMESLAGSVGYYVARWLYGAIKIGLPVILVFLAAAYLFLVHHVRMPSIKLPHTVEKKEPLPAAPLKVQTTTEPPVSKTNDCAVKGKTSLVAASSVSPVDVAVPPQASPAANGEPTPAQSAASAPSFDIDDEFSRINKRAQGKQEPSFTIIDKQEPALPAEHSAATEPVDEQPAKARHYGIDELYDPKLDLPHYEMPKTDILVDWERNNVKVTNEEMLVNKDKIVETLGNYGIGITNITASPGPTVTLYEVIPAPGIRISKIKSLEDDIALSLSALGIRIIAPIPGRGTVGIEVPNAKPQVVSMKTMLESTQFADNTKFELPIAFGKTIGGEPFVTDLAKMPHLLMAGATGTGKSVGLNAVITSLLYKKHPCELKFVMVDPKKVELSLYNRIERQYLAKLPDQDDGSETESIITDVKRVVRTLNSLCIEMDNRYDLLKRAGVRKIKEYNEKIIHRQLVVNENDPKAHHFMPYIVLVIDEFADLIMTAGKEVETPICRLAQLARAVGIHLIIATQRPTTNIITGTIKANFPARIAFRVTSAIDSRTILDTGGAQQLIGRGDMLISLSGSDILRCQCALVETEEIEQLANYVGNQEGFSDDKMFTLPEYLDENDAPNKDFDPKAKDEFFNDAARLVVTSQFGSTSLLQRKLQLGYNRAGRIIDQLEAAGIVGPYNGSKARDVLIKDEMELEERLQSL
ncbi:MAG: DNA translocase FtsK 4TM domain-containing protein [Bacteroidales bacterium]|nr:DNA translocase FtsK 4TM domain-containing protein [Bacteroidales bacterium]